ncbi:MAG: GIY-YIG nuclease family protein [Candidatus Doudnabacteria bacterium]|nr:GIY-YIG nuclease family protein [Candidatus Doudnabacteria bacterium]
MYVYILLCSNDRYYVGSTPDLYRRITEHRSAKNAATKNLLPIELVFSQQFSSLLEARRAEAWIKRQKDRSLVEKIIAHGTILKNFSQPK